MRLSVTLALLTVGLTTLSDATFIIETAAAGTASTVGVGTAAGAAALAGIGGLVLGAGIVGAIALSRRGKRSVENALKEDAIFNLVASSDAYGCAMKLVCMLEAKDDESLSDDDKFILTIFGRAPEAPSIDKMKSARGAYDYAAFMGHKFGVDACEELFHTCEATYETMIAYVAKLRA
ncbi:uncharacterized protein LOC122394266 [Amphibalanus amphitrite]|uniref:uncharacterized protein LOC122394266 n=1 Tax=Amphibalanus amphitrite TaxID=1232801 RepID=UPI001C9085E2|nr:uncharacterized protein LOC122394266 [Amphibalanus amphitrite]